MNDVVRPEDELTNWPRDPEAPHRYLCTPEKPRPMNAGGQWSHKGVHSVGECPDGCCDDYECRDCKVTWRVECAQ
jgi:hypothetical protein